MEPPNTDDLARGVAEGAKALRADAESAIGEYPQRTAGRAADAEWLANIETFLRGCEGGPFPVQQITIRVPPPAARRLVSRIPVSRLLARDPRFILVGSAVSLAVSLRESNHDGVGVAASAAMLPPPSNAPTTDFATAIFDIIRRAPGVMGSEIGNHLRNVGIAIPKIGLLRAASTLPGISITRIANGSQHYNILADASVQPLPPQPSQSLQPTRDTMMPQVVRAAPEVVRVNNPRGQLRSLRAASKVAGTNCSAADGAGDTCAAALVASILSEAEARGGTRMVAIAKALKSFCRTRGITRSSPTMVVVSKRRQTLEKPEESIARAEREGVILPESAAQYRRELLALRAARSREREAAGRFAGQDHTLDDFNGWLRGFGLGTAESKSQARNTLRRLYVNIYDVMNSNVRALWRLPLAPTLASKPPH